MGFPAVETGNNRHVRRTEFGYTADCADRFELAHHLVCGTRHPQWDLTPPRYGAFPDESVSAGGPPVWAAAQFNAGARSLAVGAPDLRLAVEAW